MGNGSLFWPIVIILGILAIAYFFPTQFTGFTKWGGDGIKSIIGGVTNQKCPTDDQPVCGSNSINYKNSCYAQKAKVNYTVGPC
jgi:hypothetical protein